MNNRSLCFRDSQIRSKPYTSYPSSPQSTKAQSTSSSPPQSSHHHHSSAAARRSSPPTPPEDDFMSRAMAEYYALIADADGEFQRKLRDCFVALRKEEKEEASAAAARPQPPPPSESPSDLLRSQVQIPPPPSSFSSPSPVTKTPPLSSSETPSLSPDLADLQSPTSERETLSPPTPPISQPLSQNQMRDSLPPPPHNPPSPTSRNPPRPRTFSSLPPFRETLSPAQTRNPTPPSPFLPRCKSPPPNVPPISPPSFPIPTTREIQKQQGESIASNNPKELTLLFEQRSGSELIGLYEDLEEQNARVEEETVLIYQSKNTVVEFTLEKGDGSTFSPEPGSVASNTATIQIVIDGFAAPLTAGNFAKLIVDGESAMGRHMEFITISWPYDRGKPKLVMSEERVIDRGRADIGALDSQLGSDVCYHCFEMIIEFDSSSFCSWLVRRSVRGYSEFPCVDYIGAYLRLGCVLIFVFDPGIST